MLKDYGSPWSKLTLTEPRKEWVYPGTDEVKKDTFLPLGGGLAATDDVNNSIIIISCAKADKSGPNLS
jgi:hypothetical protein